MERPFVGLPQIYVKIEPHRTRENTWIATKINGVEDEFPLARWWGDPGQLNANEQTAFVLNRLHQFGHDVSRITSSGDQLWVNNGDFGEDSE